LVRFLEGVDERGIGIAFPDEEAERLLVFTA
jgi:hypothetical protein